MKKLQIIILGISISTTLVGCSTTKLPVENAHIEQSSSHSSFNTVQSSSASNNEIIKVQQTAPAGWTTYINHTLGFSMHLPNEAYAGGTAGIAPVIAIEDPVNNSVYITLKYYDDRFGQPQDTVDMEHRKETTLATLKSDSSIGPRYWLFQGVHLNDKAQIDSWIKEKFGLGCNLKELKPTEQAGIMEVIIEGDGKELDETKCFMNFTKFIRYSEIKQLLIYGAFGTDVGFLKDINGVSTYDSEIINSIRIE